MSRDKSCLDCRLVYNYSYYYTLVLQGCVKVLRPVAFRPPHQLGGQEETSRYTLHGGQEEKIRSPRHHQQPGQQHRYDSKLVVSSY